MYTHYFPEVSELYSSGSGVTKVNKQNEIEYSPLENTSSGLLKSAHQAMATSAKILTYIN